VLKQGNKESSATAQMKPMKTKKEKKSGIGDVDEAKMS